MPRVRIDSRSLDEAQLDIARDDLAYQLRRWRGWEAKEIRTRGLRNYDRSRGDHILNDIQEAAASFYINQVILAMYDNQ